MDKSTLASLKQLGENIAASKVVVNSIDAKAINAAGGYVAVEEALKYLDTLLTKAAIVVQNLSR